MSKSQSSSDRLEACRVLGEAFIRASLAVLRQVAQSLPTIPTFHAKPPDARGRVEFEESTRSDWYQLAGPASEQLLGLDEAKHFKKAMSGARPFSTAIGAQVRLGGHTGVTFDSANDIARKFLLCYLLRAGCGRFRDRAFDESWSSLCAYLDANTAFVGYTVYAPVYNIHLPGRKIVLEDGLELRRLSPSQVASLATRDRIFAGRLHGGSGRRWTHFFLVERLSVAKVIVRDAGRKSDESSSIPEFPTRIPRELLLLRALYSQSVFIRAFVVQCDEPGLAAWSMVNYLSWPHMEVVALASGVTSLLKKSGKGLPGRPGATENADCDGLSDLFQQAVTAFEPLTRYRKVRTQFLTMEKDDEWRRVFQSMRRFVAAWGNPSPEDVLTDLVAAIESLLVWDSGELSYKVRVRGAALLGGDINERTIIAKDLKDAYALRSKVVHGAYVFDALGDRSTADRLGAARGEGGNPFHDINEINRLTGTLVDYFRSLIRLFVRVGSLKREWEKLGL